MPLDSLVSFSQVLSQAGEKSGPEELLGIQEDSDIVLRSRKQGGPAWINKKHLTELRHKNEVYKRWKQGQVT